MNTHQDFEEFLRLLTANKVEFVIVGGYAVAFYGYLRLTKDLDLLYRNTPENIVKLKSALESFGINTGDLKDTTFSEAGKIIRIGVAPVLIEMINAVSGLAFADIWEHKTAGSYGDTDVFYISRDDLLKNKQASGRPQDIADYEALRNNPSQG